MASTPLIPLNTGSDTGQIAPPDVSRSRFDADQNRFLENLKRKGLDTSLYASVFHPYPFALDEKFYAELLALQDSLKRALPAIARNFFTDPRLQRRIALSPDEENLLRRFQTVPYRIGAFRPDFVFSADGRPMITEINARFPLNGFLSSWWLNETMPAEYPGLRPLPALAALPSSLMARFSPEGEIGIVRSNEPGWDIHLLQTWLPDRCRAKTPDLVTPEDVNRWKNIVFELDQPEFLRQLSSSAITELTQHPGLLNDLRTIFIIHDKRMLSILSSPEIMGDYVNEEDRNRLARHVVPTWVKGLSPETVALAQNGHSRWLAKPPRDGKGRGILVSHHVTPPEWRKALDALPPDWILQPYIEQTKFPILMPSKDGLETVSARVVGLLPSLDDEGFGPGMFRAADDDIVNVARGGMILTPAFRDHPGEIK